MTNGIAVFPTKSGRGPAAVTADTALPLLGGYATVATRVG